MFPSDERISTQEDGADNLEQQRRETENATEREYDHDDSNQEDDLNSDSGAPDKKGCALTLEDFREALNAHRNADRLIIDPNDITIRPWSEADSKAKEKNEIIITALQAALQAAFPRIDVEKMIEEELPQPSMLKQPQGRSALSGEILYRILSKADEAMSVRNFVEQNSFTIQHFHNALAHPDNKGAQHLIISGEGASARIVAQAKSSQVENTIIRKTLKRALEQEGHHKNFVHELVSKMLPRKLKFMTGVVRVPLSFEKLKTIIQQADDAMAEMKLLRATHSITPLSSTVASRAATRKFLRSSIENFFNRLGIQNDILANNISQAFIPKSAEEIAAEHAVEARQAELEQSEIKKNIRSLLLRGRNPEFLKNHYAEAEAATIATEAARHQAMEARWEAEKKEKFLIQARSFFKEAKAALEEQRSLAEFDPSMLSKISQSADLTGVLLGMFNLPLVNAKGITDAISTFAQFADQKLTVAKTQKAYNTLQAAIQKAETATQGSKNVETAADTIELHAKKLEDLKKKEDHNEALRLSRLIQLPSDPDDAALREWAIELACEADDAVNDHQAKTTAYLLYKQAKKNPDTIHDLISRLWGERVAFSQQELKQLEEKTSFAINNPEDLEYKSAHEKEKKLEAEAVSARARFEEAQKAKREWLSKHDQLREEKKTLENQLLTLDREKSQKELDQKRSELSTHQLQKEGIDDTYKTRLEEATRLTALARAAHEKAFEKFQIAESAKNFQIRNITRLQTAAEADLNAFDEVLIAENHRQQVKYKAQAAALASSDETARAHQDKIIEMLQAVGFCYEAIAEAQAKGNREAAVVLRKAAQAGKNLAVAYISGDETAAEHQGKIAEALAEAGKCYIKAAEEQAKGNGEAAEAFRKSAQAYEAQAAALALSDTTAETLGAIGFCYKQAIEEQAKGNREAAEACRKLAQGCEAQVAALISSDETAIVHQEKIVTALDSTAGCYIKAAEEQGKGNGEAAEVFRKSAQVYEAQAAALALDDTTAELHEKTAAALEYAGRSYSRSAEELAKGNGEAAEAFRKEAQAYEAQATALTSGDEIAAELQGKIAEMFKAVGLCYHEATEAQAKGDREAVEDFRKTAQGCESFVAALNSGDETAIVHQEKIVKALWAVVGFYIKAAKEQAKGNGEAAEAYRKIAQGCEAQAAALISGDETAIVHQEKIVKALLSTVDCYHEAAEEQAKGNVEAAEALRKSAQAYEAQAAALTSGDETAIVHQEKIARALAEAGNCCKEAAEEQAKGNVEAAEALRKAAQAYEAQAAALTAGNETAVVHQEKIAEALELANICYKEAVEEQVKGNGEAAEAWHKAAQAYEAQAAALTSGDETAAELQEKIAEALWSAGGYYKEAAEKQAEGNGEEAEALRKRAQASEAEAVQFLQMFEATQENKPTDGGNSTSEKKGKRKCIIS